jgi:hypothetical protein
MAQELLSTFGPDLGEVVLALGPQTPVFALSNDPRGWAFLDDSASFIGGPALSSRRPPTSNLHSPSPGPALPRWDHLSSKTLDRGGGAEVGLALIPASGLTRRLPVS